ncbi:MAG: HYExAFE family protein [Planctomycetota bacterium]
MANRRNHYEAAFEAYLRQERIAYVAVDEQRRSLVGDGSLKSLDFIVSPAGDPPAGRHNPTRWLVDVKGRKFPSGVKQPQYWRNWSTGDDLRSLQRWQQEFGGGFTAALVFAYQLTAERAPTPPEQVFYHRGTPYAFVGIRLADYAADARTLSPRWGTVSMPVGQFRERAEPLLDLFCPPPPGDDAPEFSADLPEHGRPPSTSGAAARTRPW